MNTYKELCQNIIEKYELLKNEKKIIIDMCDGLSLHVYVNKMPELSEDDISLILRSYSTVNPLCKNELKKCKSCFYESIKTNVDSIHDIFTTDRYNVLIRHNNELVGVFVLIHETSDKFTIWNVCRLNSKSTFKKALIKGIYNLIHSDFFEQFQFELTVHPENPAKEKYKSIGFVEIGKVDNLTLMRLDR